VNSQVIVITIGDFVVEDRGSLLQEVLSVGKRLHLIDFCASKRC